MIIEIPHGYIFSKEGDIIAFEENGKLKIRPWLGLFDDVMYDLTYKLKGDTRCYYCGKTVETDEIHLTLDHIHPRALGGPTIPQNLVPACKKCNGRKENMTPDQFNAYMSLDDFNKRKAFKKEFFKIKDFQERWVHVLPDDWTSQTPIGELFVSIDLNDTSGSKYRKCKDFYQRTGHFRKPIVIDSHRFVLDGFTEVLYAKNNKIREIPTIVLENVEVIF